MLLALSLWLTVASQAPSPRVVLYDVSAPDAIYEDEARQAAKAVVARLEKAGVMVVRSETESMPERRCRVGPCLAKIAATHQAQVLITFDAAEEVPGERYSIACAALAAHNGSLLTARRWVVKKPQDGHPQLEKFAAALKGTLDKLMNPPDGG